MFDINANVRVWGYPFGKERTVLYTSPIHHSTLPPYHINSPPAISNYPAVCLRNRNTEWLPLRHIAILHVQYRFYRELIVRKLKMLTFAWHKGRIKEIERSWTSFTPIIGDLRL